MSLHPWERQWTRKPQSVWTGMWGHILSQFVMAIWTIKRSTINWGWWKWGIYLFVIVSNWFISWCTCTRLQISYQLFLYGWRSTEMIHLTSVSSFFVFGLRNLRCAILQWYIGQRSGQMVTNCVLLSHFVVFDAYWSTFGLSLPSASKTLWYMESGRVCIQYNTGNSCCSILTPTQPNISGSQHKAMLRQIAL